MAYGTTAELIEVIKGKAERGEPIEFSVTINGEEYPVTDYDSWMKVYHLGLAEFEKHGEATA